MKKLLLSMLATLGVAVILPASAFAAGPISDVTGTVTNNKGGIAIGANVSVTCHGNTLTTVTNGGGGYIVQFTSAACPSGSTAVVTASEGSVSGSNHGKVFPGSSINLAMVNVTGVPELGALTGIGAAVLGGAAFMVVRRKHLNQN